MAASPISPECIREQLGKILASVPFADADRSRELLKFVVERSLKKEGDRLKEYTLGTEVLGRNHSSIPVPTA